MKPTELCSNLFFIHRVPESMHVDGSDAVSYSISNKLTVRLVFTEFDSYPQGTTTLLEPPWRTFFSGRLTLSLLPMDRAPVRLLEQS